jgi:hypothetical protein
MSKVGTKRAHFACIVEIEKCIVRQKMVIPKCFTLRDVQKSNDRKWPLMKKLVVGQLLTLNG